MIRRYLHAGGPYSGQIRALPVEGSPYSYWASVTTDLAYPLLEAEAGYQSETVRYNRWDIPCFGVTIVIYSAGSGDDIRDVILSSVARAALAEG